MNGLSLAIDLVALAVAVGVLVGRLLRFRRLRIDHVVLFVVGHAYYISASSVLAHLGVLRDSFASPYDAFDDVAPTVRVLASAWGLAVLVVFLVVTRLTRPGPLRTPPVRVRRRIETVAPATAMAVGALGLFLAAAVFYRRVLIEGYGSADPTQIQSQAGRGTLAAMATASVLTSLYARHVVVGVPLRRRRRLLADAVFGLGVAVPILVLPIGGNRLYSVTLVLLLVVWFTQVRRPVRRGVVVGVAAIGLVMLIGLGSVRIRQAPSLATTGYYTVSEAAFNAWSRDLLLDAPVRLLQPVAVPKYLASDLVNIVPRALLPAKDDLRLDPADDGLDITSPLGGVHVLASLWINFGWLGSLAAVAGAAYGLRRLQWRVRRRPTALSALTYAVLAGALAMSCFRDPFGISLVRWWLVSGVVTILGLHAVGTVVAVAGHRPAPVPARPA